MSTNCSHSPLLYALLWYDPHRFLDFLEDPWHRCIHIWLVLRDALLGKVWTTSSKSSCSYLNNAVKVTDTVTSTTVRLSLFLFFWTRNEGPRTGSRQKHHSSAVRITVIIYTTMTKLFEDCEKETQAAGRISCKLFRRRASYHCACQPHHWGHRGTSTSVPSVSKDPSTIDANHRSHPFVATIRRHHHRY